MLTKIYAVIQCDVDNTNIVALTLSKEKAERLAKLNKGRYCCTDPWIEEYVDDTDYMPPDIKQNRYVFQPYWDATELDNYNYDEIGVYRDDDVYEVGVYADNKEDARAKAMDMFCKYKAEHGSPGTTISEMLQFNQYPMLEFAEDIGMTMEEATLLLNDRIPITQKIAKELETSVGLPAYFWTNLDGLYRKRQSEIQNDIR